MKPTASRVRPNRCRLAAEVGMKGLEHTLARGSCENRLQYCATFVPSKLYWWHYWWHSRWRFVATHCAVLHIVPCTYVLFSYTYVGLRFGALVRVGL